MPIEAASSHPLGIARVTTPEAVVLEFQTAGMWARGGARILDTIFQGLILGVLAAAVGATSGDGLNFEGTASVFAIVILYFVAFTILFLYHPFFEVRNHGCTPGKGIMNLRVMAVDGTPVRFRHSVLRSAFDIVDIFGTSGIVGAVSIFASRRGQRLGDHVAGTLVISQKIAEHVVPVYFPSPYGCEQFVQQLDVHGLSRTQYDLIRAALLRAPTLPPTSRGPMMEKIAAPLVLRVNLGPLPYMDPEKYLACLAAAFQIRSSKSILARAGRLRATRAVHQSGYQPPELSSIFAEPVG